MIRRAILKLIYRKRGQSSQQTPNIIINNASPALLDLSFTGVTGFDTYEYSYDDDIDFSSIQGSGTGNSLIVNDIGQGRIYIRVRGINNTTGQKTRYAFQDLLLESTQLRSLSISAQANDGVVTITHDCQADETGVSVVSVQRRTPGGIFQEIDTFVPGTAPYTDNTVVNGTTYEYRLNLVPESLDYLASSSNIQSASPQAGLTDLSAPINLNVSWSISTIGEGTFNFTDSSGGNAENFEVAIKDGVTVIDTVSLVAPTTSYAFTGLVAGTNYTFEVYATGTGFDDSPTSSINRTAIDPNEPVIDMEADHGMEAYYLPLDGRQFDDSLYGGAGTFDFPLCNIEPLGDGSSRVTAVTNDGLGTVVNNVFDANTVGKTFVAFNAHLNGDLGAFADEYIPNSVSARYATVTSYDVTNGSWVIVDFEYNGGDPVTPQPTTNAYAYIGKDNTAEWANLVADWQVLARPARIVGQPLSRNGYVLNAYYIREWTQVNLSNGKNFQIGTADGSPMRIKHGVEQRYLGDVTWKLATNTLYNTDTDRLFFASGAVTPKLITHNVEFISPHRAYVPSTKYMIGGGPNAGEYVFVGNYTMREWDELHNGYGFDTDFFLWQMSSQDVDVRGEYAGEGAFYDVTRFGFVAFINGDYSGPSAAGVTGGFTRGAHFNVYDNVTINFNPQIRWASAEQYCRTRLTTDLSNINNTGGFDDPAQHTDYLPSHAVETDDGNYFRTRVSSPNNRLHIYYVKDDTTDQHFAFPWNWIGNSAIDDYLFWCYNNNKPVGERLSRSVFSNNQPDGLARNSISNIKSLVPWQIPRVGEVTTISRQALFTLPIAGNGASERFDNPQISCFSENSIKSMINWGLAFQKPGDQFTADELAYVRNIDRYPFHAQPGDQFKLVAWVEVDDDTGFVKGQNVTVRDGANATITTGEIVEVDNLMFTRRIKIKGATVNVVGANNITNGTQTANITATSDFDPTQLYTVMRFQGGTYNDDVYGVGFVRSYAQARMMGYHPWIYIISPDLPSIITGADVVNDLTATNLMFEVEWTTSQAEILLDGQYRDSYIGYLGFPRMGIDAPPTTRADEQFKMSDVSKRVIDAHFKGIGLSYDGGTNNPLGSDPHGEDEEGFDKQITQQVDTLGHAAYNRAELTWYVRMPQGWQDTPYRQFISNSGNNSYLRPAGDTAYKTNDFSARSKGIFVIGEAAGWNNLLNAESASSRDQFNRTQLLYDANPSYTEPLMTAEEMLPPDEVAPYRAKVRVYGQTAIDYWQAVRNDYGVAGSVVYNTDVNDAPDLPKTIRDILTSIGEI